MTPPEAELRATRDYFGFQLLEPIEKDWHVMQAMRAIALVNAEPFRLVFAGGTCLARGHRLVQRMSEDVDFKVELLNATPPSRARLRRDLGDLRERITANLQSAGFQFDPTDPLQLRSRDGNHYTVYNLNVGSGSADTGPLRPTIQIELNFTSIRQPTISLPVWSFVAEAYGRQPEVQRIDCVSITETAAEKFVSLTRRTAMELAGESRNPDPTLVRHIHDLHMIRDHIDGSAAIALIRDIAAQDAEEFAAQHPAYRDDIAGETWKALAFLRDDPSVRDRHERFVEAMVYGERSSFNEAMATVMQLAEQSWPKL